MPGGVGRRKRGESCLRYLAKLDTGYCQAPRTNNEEEDLFVLEGQFSIGPDRFGKHFYARLPAGTQWGAMDVTKESIIYCKYGT